MSRTLEAMAVWLYLEWVYKPLTAWHVQITIFLLIFSVPKKALIVCRSLWLWRNPSSTVIAYEELSMIALLWYLMLTFPFRGKVISVWFSSNYFAILAFALNLISKKNQFYQIFHFTHQWRAISIYCNTCHSISNYYMY